MQNKTTERPLYFYVANLGSEIQRIFVWKEKGDREAMQNAYNRAISIIDKIKVLIIKAQIQKWIFYKNILINLFLEKVNIL